MGNATIANITTDIVKSIYTNEENKPATKGNMQNLLKDSKKLFI